MTTTTRSQTEQKTARKIRVLNRLWVRRLVDAQTYHREHGRLVAELKQARS